MPAIHVLLPAVLQPGKVGLQRVKWFYEDKSDNDIINPSIYSPFHCRLLDPQGNNRAPNQTETTLGAGVTFTPTEDNDGGFYVDVDMSGDPNAQPGLWTIEATFVWENEQTTLVLGVHCRNDGGTVGAPPGDCFYTTPADVTRFLTRNHIIFDKNTILTDDDVYEHIRDAMAQIDSYTMRTFCTASKTETLDATYSDKWRWHGDYIVSLQVSERPIVGIQSLKVWRGGEESEIVSEGPDRGSTWYTHDETGHIYIVGSDIPSILRNAVEVTYTHGKNYTTETVPRDVRKACTQLVAAIILESDYYAVELPEWSATAGTYADKIERWENRAYDLLDRWRDVAYAAGGG